MRCDVSCRLQMSIDMAGSPAGLPHLWSAEQPRLYVLVLSLLASDGRLIEAESCQVTSRTPESVSPCNVCSRGL